MKPFQRALIPTRISGRNCQLFTTLLGNFITLNYGMMFGSTSAVIVLYQSKDTPLIDGPISDYEASWIGSDICIGAIIGTLAFGLFSEKFGRKIGIMISGIPQLISWLFVVFGYKMLHIHLSRFLNGITAGAAFSILPVFISELAEDKTRGSLGSYVTAFRNLGMFSGFVMGAFLTPAQTSYIGLTVSIVFNLLFPYANEAPYFYVIQNKMDLAEKSLRHFRGLKRIEAETNREFQDEMEKLRQLRIRLNISDQQKFQIKEMMDKSVVKAMIISLVLVTCTQFAGIYALLNYATIIFLEAKSNVAPDISSVLLAGIQLVGAYVTTMVADKIPRKVLISISATTAALSLSGFGLILFLKEQGIEKDFFGIILLICLCLAVFIVSAGLYPLTYVVIAEVIPPKFKTMLTTFFFAYSWFLSFLTVRYFYTFVELFNLYGCMWIFAGFCLFATIFTLLFVPETRGKSFDDIQKDMQK